ncbi:AzlD domain-containing protein [Nigerium massiliense]|uniref:AzlD domain-containing protein n=1 Tax=Nigerium massiliense TaxID=1522317 RepID=UPI00058EF4D1|nr:AzlD domain-containing protein [Nigerium massiliense]
MTPLGWVLVAAAIAFVTKLVGYLLPGSWLDSPTARAMSGAVTVGLLASLVVTNTFVAGTSVQLDARVAAFVAAIVALILRAPFIVVVIVGALAAAAARAMGAA